MTRSLLGIFATIVAVGVSAQPVIPSYMSLRQFQELEAGATDKSVGSQLVTIYLGGVVESLTIANAMLEKNRQSALFCIPNSGLSAQKVRVLVESYVQKNKSILSPKDFAFFEQNITVGAAAVFVLVESYPCK